MVPARHTGEQCAGAAGGARTRDIGLERVADHHELIGRQIELGGGSAEQVRLGLAEVGELQAATGEPPRERRLEEKRDRARGKSELAAALGIDEVGVRQDQRGWVAGLDGAHDRAERLLDAAQEIEAAVVAYRDRVDLADIVRERDRDAAALLDERDRVVGSEDERARAGQLVRREVARQQRARGAESLGRERDVMAREPSCVGRLRARCIVRHDSIRRAAPLELCDQGARAGQRTARVEQHAVHVEQHAGVEVEKCGDGGGLRLRHTAVLYGMDARLPRPASPRARTR